MKSNGSAGSAQSEFPWCRLIFTALFVFLLLSVQTGLGYHGASHIHGLEDLGDCSICVVGSHYFAEWGADQDQWEADPVSFLPAEEAIFLPLISLLPAAARGPPAVFV